MILPSRQATLDSSLRDPILCFSGRSRKMTRGKTVEVFHILRPEMDRSGLELSIDNLFTKKYWKLNEKQNI